MKPQIHIHKDGASIGPFTHDEILARLQSGYITPDDLAWQDGFIDWQPVKLLLATLKPKISSQNRPATAGLTAQELISSDASTLALNTSISGSSCLPDKVKSGRAKIILGVAIACIAVLIAVFTNASRTKKVDVTHNENRTSREKVEPTPETRPSEKPTRLELTGKTQANQTAAVASTTSQPSKSRVLDEPKKPVVGTQGQWLNAGNFSYKIDKATRSKLLVGGGATENATAEALVGLMNAELDRQLGHIGNQNKKEPQDEANFLVIRYSIKNEGADAMIILGDNFIVQDSKGRRFKPDKEVTIKFLETGDRASILKELQPGITYETLQGFRLPADSFAGPLVISIPGKPESFIVSLEVKGALQEADSELRAIFENR